MSAFPETSLTLIAKIRDLPPGQDNAAWVRFWDSYALAMRQFAAMKGGEANADDILLRVLAKLVTVLREGRYNPQTGRLHSYIVTMILNEIRMDHRKDEVRARDRQISLDAPIAGGEGTRTVAETIAAPPETPERLDADWRAAVLASAEDFVLNRTAISARDRRVWAEYVQKNRPIEEVAAEFRLSRNAVSQIKTRISRRIVDKGRELVAGMP